MSVPDAEALAAADPYQFQWWALGLVGARPAEGKKGADQGIDGRIYFHDGDTGKTKQIVLSVKAGKLQAPYVRDLRGVVEPRLLDSGLALCSLVWIQVTSHTFGMNHPSFSGEHITSHAGGGSTALTTAISGIDKPIKVVT